MSVIYGLTTGTIENSYFLKESRQSTLFGMWADKRIDVSPEPAAAVRTET